MPRPAGLKPALRICRPLPERATPRHFFVTPRFPLWYAADRQSGACRPVPCRTAYVLVAPSSLQDGAAPNRRTLLRRLFPEASARRAMFPLKVGRGDVAGTVDAGES